MKAATATSIGAFSFPAVLDAAAAMRLNEEKNRISHLSPNEAARDKDFWEWVRQNYSVSRNMMNLNNGGVSPQPIITQQAQAKYTEMSNEAPSYYMWRTLDAGREPLREGLAQLAGCSPDEIAINRNTTEGLNTIIFGLDLKPGDEVVLNKYDYPNMMNAWRQREQRDGIKLVWVDMEFPMDNDGEIAQLYIDKFTDKTKLVHITHVINWVGQVIKPQKIARAARARGIDVLVDGAHSFAHLDYNIPDLECDYYATSLHKWLCAPFGTGLMYIRKEKIKDVWPVLSAPEPLSDNIRKFENLGTRSFPIEMATGYSLDFHNSIGQERKTARLKYIRNYWLEQVRDISGIKIHNSFKDDYTCALANIGHEKKDAGEIASELWKDYKIHTVSIVYENVNGVRITPHLYTSERDLDKLVGALRKILS